MNAWQTPLAIAPNRSVTLPGNLPKFYSNIFSKRDNSFTEKIYTGLLCLSLSLLFYVVNLNPSPWHVINTYVTVYHIILKKSNSLILTPKSQLKICHPLVILTQLFPFFHFLLKKIQHTHNMNLHDTFVNIYFFENQYCIMFIFM
jgi:hypothetical protein